MKLSAGAVPQWPTGLRLMSSSTSGRRSSGLSDFALLVRLK